MLDIDRALYRVGGDVDYLRDLVGIFRAASGALQEQVRQAVACGDAHAVQKAAHLFKAAADIVSAIEIYDSALQLELMAQAGRLQGAGEACEKLEQALTRLSPELAAFENTLWFTEC